MDNDRSYLARFLYTFRLYEVTVAVALFVYVVVFIVFLCVVRDGFEDSMFEAKARPLRGQGQNC